MVTGGTIEYLGSNQASLAQSIMGYVFRYSGKHQIGLAALARSGFRAKHGSARIAAAHYQRCHKEWRNRHHSVAGRGLCGVALAEQGLKLILNVYRD